MKRFLIALNLIIWTVVAVEARADQIDNKPHGNPLYLYSTKDMGGNIVRATYGVKWKSGEMTYTNIELVCGSLQARDIGYSNDGTGTVWQDRSKDLYNGKKYYALVGSGNEGSIQYNVYRAVCKTKDTVDNVENAKLFCKASQVSLNDPSCVALIKMAKSVK